MEPSEVLEIQSTANTAMTVSNNSSSWTMIVPETVEAIGFPGRSSYVKDVCLRKCGTYLSASTNRAKPKKARGISQYLRRAELRLASSARAAERL